MNDFDVLSNFYDRLMSYNGIDEWIGYVVNTIKRYLKKGQDSYYGVDIGCGTGTFTRALVSAGLKTVGVDTSLNMLNKAVEKGGEYLMQSITGLKGFTGLDFAVAINDVVNYVPHAKLTKAFESVYRSLKKGGVFLFDISSEFKFREIIANNLFSEDDEEVTYLWFNKLGKRSVNMDLTYFIKGENGLYDRLDESFTEYIYTQEEITKTLETVGFKVKAVKGHLGAKVTDKSERLNFIAIKI